MYRLSIIFAMLLCVVACDMEKYPEARDTHSCELLIYSGITLVQPLEEIAALVEDKMDCRIRISSGDSGHLLRSIRVNKVGDIFFPGSASYLNTLVAGGLITQNVQIGFNQAKLFVQPGNPMDISADLNNLTNERFNVVLGNERAGSIGKETKRILSEAGIYRDALDNSLYLTTDSKGLANAIKNHDADLVINWNAVAFLPENHGKMESLPLPDIYVKKQPIVMGILKYSQHPDIARKVLDLSVSAVGQNIFRKYGFLD